MSNSWDTAHLLWSSMNKEMLYLALGATYWFAIQAKRPLKKEEKESIIKKSKLTFKHSIIRHALKETLLTIQYNLWLWFYDLPNPPSMQSSRKVSQRYSKRHQTICRVWRSVKGSDRISDRDEVTLLWHFAWDSLRFWKSWTAAVKHAWIG